MQKYALRKVVTPSEREQLDNKQWKKDVTKQSYLPTRSSSRASDSSKTTLLNNRKNSLSKPQSTKSVLNNTPKSINTKKNEIIIEKRSSGRNAIESPNSKYDNDSDEPKKRFNFRKI